jgi:hypothetical protein
MCLYQGTNGVGEIKGSNQKLDQRRALSFPTLTQV